MVPEDSPHPSTILCPSPAPARDLGRARDPLLPRKGKSKWHNLLQDLADEHDHELTELRRENAELREQLGQSTTNPEICEFSWKSLAKGSQQRQSRQSSKNGGSSDTADTIEQELPPASLAVQSPHFPRGRPPYMTWTEDASPAPPNVIEDSEANLVSEIDEPRCRSKRLAHLLDGPSDDPKELEEPGLAKRELHSPRWMQDWQRRLMDVFEQIDSDCSGTIDLAEMKKVFAAAKLPVDQADAFIKEVDVSGDGVVDRIEWLHMLEENNQEEAPEWLREFSLTLAKIQAKNGRIYPEQAEPSYPFIIRQESVFRMSWDMFLTLLLFYIALMLPFALGFGLSDVQNTIDRVVDAFFMVDVILNFRTSYTDRDDVVVMNGRRIACNYLKTWFFLDFVSSFPFEDASSGLLPNLQPAKLLKIGKIMKVFKMLRLGKLNKIFSNSELADELGDALFTKSNQMLLKVGRLIMAMLLLSHWLACMMAASGDEWTKIGKVTEDDDTQLEKYLSAMYWAMTTLTTVGYGDITPYGSEELAYAILAMVVGGSFYGYIIGKISSSISSLDLSAQAYYNRMEEVNSWLEYHTELPRSLRRRIRNYFKNTLSAKSAVPDAMICDDLSPSLIKDVSFFLVQDEVRMNGLFANLPDSALSHLMPILVKCAFDRGEPIVSRGHPGNMMYILAEGGARFEQGHQWKATESKDLDDQGRGHVLQPGDSFGEEIILQLEETYQYTVISTAKTSMFTISEQAFSERFRMLPDIRKKMVENFKENKAPEKKPERVVPNNSMPEGFHESVLDMLQEVNTRLHEMGTIIQRSASITEFRGRAGDDVSV